MQRKSQDWLNIYERKTIKKQIEDPTNQSNII